MKNRPDRAAPENANRAFSGELAATGWSDFELFRYITVLLQFYIKKSNHPFGISALFRWLLLQCLILMALIAASALALVLVKNFFMLFPPVFFMQCIIVRTNNANCFGYRVAISKIERACFMPHPKMKTTAPVESPAISPNMTV